MAEHAPPSTSELDCKFEDGGFGAASIQVTKRVRQFTCILGALKRRRGGNGPLFGWFGARRAHDNGTRKAADLVTVPDGATLFDIMAGQEGCGGVPRRSGT